MQVSALEIASVLNGSLWGENIIVEGFASLSKAKQNEISFWTEKIQSGDARITHAGVVLVPLDFKGNLGFSKAFIFVKNPYAAMVSFLKHFALPIKYPKRYIAENAQRHATAVIDGVVHDGAVIGPHCIVMHGAIVGQNAVLEANVTLYPGVTIGDNVIVQAGAVIGSCGFGFYTDEEKRFLVPHLAGVLIGKNSSIGANTVIAAGFLSPTTIGENTHIDALVQIGHNCTVGNRVFMAAQCALAGSTIVEDDVEMGGAAKASGHLTIGQGAKIAAKAGVIKNVPPKKTFAGFPAREISEWRKEVIALRHLNKRDI